MRSGISEFSYGYAVTEALVQENGTSITAAPVFPSLIEEGSPGGGYDLRLDRVGIPLFIQFKLSEYMTGRRNSVEIKQGLFYGVFYRMHLRPLRRSSQHALLLDLENAGNEVYYVAPLFHELYELNSCYLSKQVLNRSVFFRPTVIGPLPDDGEHHVSFQDVGDAYLCSQPKHISPSIGFEALTRHFYARLSNNDVVLREKIQQIRYEMVGILDRYNPDMFTSQTLAVIRQMQNPLEAVSLITRSFFDCTLYIVYERENS